MKKLLHLLLISFSMSGAMEQSTLDTDSTSIVSGEDKSCFPAWSQLPAEIKALILSFVPQLGTLKDFENLKLVDQECLHHTQQATKDRTVFVLMLEKNPEEAARLFVNAAGVGNKVIVEAFIKAGININTTGTVQKRDYTSQETALTWAVKNQRAAIVEFLLDHKADVETRNSNGHTPLMVVISNSLHKHCHENVAMARLLIQKGANVNAENGCGTRLLTFAKRSGHKDLVELLRCYRAREDGYNMFMINEQCRRSFPI